MLTENILVELKKIVGNPNVILDKQILRNYSRDMSYQEPHLPDIVVMPESIKQIGQIMKLSNATKTYVTPYGSGTGLEGNAIPVKGGIILSLQKMDKILSIDPENLTLDAQAGVICDKISQSLRSFGLWLPTFPSTGQASLGGIISTNASGKWSILYGCTGDYVLEMDVVLANGEIIHLGRPVAKTVSGYDLKRLFVGSEGTLGVIVQAKMRLIGRRDSITLIAQFNKTEDALSSIETLRQHDLNLSVLEFADETTTALMKELGSPLSMAKAVLLLEIHYLSKRDDERISIINEICISNNCISFRFDYSRVEEAKIWNARDDIGNAIGGKYPDRVDNNGEIVVPITKFTGLVLFAHEMARESGIPVLVWGHAGQGNLHTSVLGRKNNPSELESAYLINEKLIDWAIKAGGTATGEHGIGISKLHHVQKEHPTTLTHMQAIKKLFDPNNILNPGKKIPMLNEV